MRILSIMNFEKVFNIYRHHLIYRINYFFLIPIPPAYIQQAIYLLLIESLFNNLCGVPDSNGIWRNVFCDYRKCPNDCSVTDFYAR